MLNIKLIPTTHDIPAIATMLVPLGNWWLASVSGPGNKFLDKRLKILNSTMTIIRALLSRCGHANSTTKWFPKIKLTNLNPRHTSHRVYACSARELRTSLCIWSQLITHLSKTYRRVGPNWCGRVLITISLESDVLWAHNQVQTMFPFSGDGLLRLQQCRRSRIESLV